MIDNAGAALYNERIEARAFRGYGHGMPFFSVFRKKI